MGDLVSDVTGRNRAQHITDHNASHARLNEVVYARDYNTLQDAVDAAVGGSVTAGASAIRTASRPLSLDPRKVYSLTDPLQIYSVNYLRVIGNGATITPSVDMPCVLDLNGVSYSRFDNLHVRINSPQVVDKGIWIYSDRSTSLRDTFGTHFYDCKIFGRYKTGFQIGNDENTGCDTIMAVGMEVQGVWSPGENTLSQVGISAGGGGNNLSHHFFHTSMVGHKTHIVAKTGCSFYGGSLNRSNLDIFDQNTVYLNVTGVRSEHAARFYEHGANASFPTQTTISDIEWVGVDLEAAGRWIYCRNGGHLTLNNIRVVSTPQGATPTIYSIASEPLQIMASGLVVDRSPLAGAFDVNNNTNVICVGYTNVDAVGSLDTQAQGLLIQSPDRKWYGLRMANDGTLSAVAV